MTAIERSVGSMSKDTSMMPSSRWWSTSYPASRNTPSMRWLVGSTSAVKHVMPFSRAAAARCSSSTEPIPRPRWASAMLKATSAERGASGPSPAS